MKFPNRITVSALFLTLVPMLVPNAASAFSTRAGARVNPVNASVFEVVPRGSGASSHYWCGAAEYARRALGAGWKAQIYIARGLGPSVTTGRRSAVQFTLDPDAAGITPTGTFRNHNSLETGESMSVQRGNIYCNRTTNQF